MLVGFDLSGRKMKERLCFSGTARVSLPTCQNNFFPFHIYKYLIAAASEKTASYSLRGGHQFRLQNQPLRIDLHLLQEHTLHSFQPVMNDSSFIFVSPFSECVSLQPLADFLSALTGRKKKRNLACCSLVLAVPPTLDAILLYAVWVSSRVTEPTHCCSAATSAIKKKKKTFSSSPALPRLP